MNFSDFISMMLAMLLLSYVCFMVIKGIFRMFFFTQKEDFETPIDFRQYD
jgi:large-conductance mechanosensitive channel